MDPVWTYASVCITIIGVHGWIHLQWMPSAVDRVDELQDSTRTLEHLVDWVEAFSRPRLNPVKLAYRLDSRCRERDPPA